MQTQGYTSVPHSEIKLLSLVWIPTQGSKLHDSQETGFDERGYSNNRTKQLGFRKMYIITYMYSIYRLIALTVFIDIFPFKTCKFTYSTPLLIFEKKIFKKSSNMHWNFILSSHVMSPNDHKLPLSANTMKSHNLSDASDANKLKKRTMFKFVGRRNRTNSRNEVTVPTENMSLFKPYSVLTRDPQSCCPVSWSSYNSSFRKYSRTNGSNIEFMTTKNTTKFIGHFSSRNLLKNFQFWYSGKLMIVTWNKHGRFLWSSRPIEGDNLVPSAIRAVASTNCWFSARMGLGTRLGRAQFVSAHIS